MLVPVSGSCTQREIVGVERIRRRGGEGGTGEGSVGTGDSARSTWAQQHAEECVGGERVRRFVTRLLNAEYLRAAYASKSLKLPYDTSKKCRAFFLNMEVSDRRAV